MNRNTMLALASVILFCGVLTVNTLANVLPINGLSTKQVSDLYPSLFTPAGLTFSIWSVIYVLLIGFVVLMWSRKQDVFMATLLPWFMASCVLNMSWILAWHYLMPALSVVIMLTLLFSLSQIFMLLQSHRAVDMKEKIFVFLPFTLYFGWICVATIANVSALLVSVRWEGGFLSPEAWTVVMMCVAAALSAFVALRFRATAFVVVVLWALLGIYLRWNTTDHAAINGTAIVLLIGLTIVFVFSLRKPSGTHA